MFVRLLSETVASDNSQCDCGDVIRSYCALCKNTIAYDPLILHKVQSVTDATEPPAPESLPTYLADGISKQDLSTLQDIQESRKTLIHYQE